MALEAEKADVVLSGRQAAVLAALVVALIAGAVLDLRLTLTLLAAGAVATCTLVMLHRTTVCLAGSRTYADPPGPLSASRGDGGLPAYTVLVPLYHEAAVVPGLLRALRALDYPRELLDVKLLLEADDQETATAIAAHTLPADIAVVEVPEGGPRTKPKACNAGLAEARGDHLVIFDAEDRPEPGQLRAAVRAFRSAPPDVACFQARLRYWNRKQNLLTRLFAADYAQKFELVLPGLERLSAPIPLGGTSNHFRTCILRDFGGWDAHNVTEDLELGLRLAAAGLRTRVLDSVTWEEANSHAPSWVRQRSRWQKGHLQTWLVLMRHPLELWRRLGPAGFLHAQVLTLGVCAAPLFHPVLYTLGILGVLSLGGVVAAPLPLAVLVAGGLQLVVSYAVAISNYATALIRSGQRDLLPVLAFVPPYLVLVSVATWRGALQLVRRPSHWEKTPHGRAVEDLPEVA
jgi:hypothetical protein